MNAAGQSELLDGQWLAPQSSPTRRFEPPPTPHLDPRQPRRDDPEPNGGNE